VRRAGAHQREGHVAGWDGAAAHGETVTLEQHKRLHHKIRAPPPRRRAQRRDLTGADRRAVVLVLSIAKSAENNALLGGHDPASLAPNADARNRTARQRLSRAAPRSVG